MASLMCSLMFLSVYSSLSFLAEVFAYLIDQYAPPFLSHICQAGPSLLDFSFLKLTARCLPPPPHAREPGPHLQQPASPGDCAPGEGWPRGRGRRLGRPTHGKSRTRHFHVATHHPGRSTRVRGPLRRLSLPCRPPQPWAPYQQRVRNQRFLLSRFHLLLRDTRCASDSQRSPLHHSYIGAGINKVGARRNRRCQ